MKAFRETSTTTISQRGVPALENKQQRRLCELWLYSPEEWCIQLRLYGDLAALNFSRWLKFKKTKYYKVSNFFGLARKLFLTCLFCFLLDFGMDSRLHFGFPTNFTGSASTLVSFSLAVVLTYFRPLIELVQVYFSCFTYLF